MNKELASHLKNKLKVLPFVDLLGGIAQTVSDDKFDEDNVKTTHRFPVSYDVDGEECQGREISMVPDSGRKSIIYFEDFGIAQNGSAHGLPAYNSSLRLICWMNRANLVGDNYTEISGRAMAEIIRIITSKKNENTGFFTRLNVSMVRVHPQDAALFGRYTYNETYRQYLRPPFEFFGIDFSCTYQVPPGCLSGIAWNNQVCY